LDQVQAAAEKYGRVFAVEYDLSGAQSDEQSVTNAIYIDFENNVEKYTNSSAYVKQDGKPYVQIYGPGTPNRGVSADDAYDLVRDLKTEKNLFIGISPDMDWGADVRNNTGFVNVYKESDLIAPWSVGNFDYAEVDEYMQGHVASDAAYVVFSLPLLQQLQRSLLTLPLISTALPSQLVFLTSTLSGLELRPSTSTIGT
jgi:hypothetical protein